MDSQDIVNLIWEPFFDQITKEFLLKEIKPVELVPNIVIELGSNRINIIQANKNGNLTPFSSFYNSEQITIDTIKKFLQESSWIRLISKKHNVFYQDAPIWEFFVNKCLHWSLMGDNINFFRMIADRFNRQKFALKEGSIITFHGPLKFKNSSQKKCIFM